MTLAAHDIPRARADWQFRARSLESAPRHAQAAIWSRLAEVEAGADYRAANMVAGITGAAFRAAKVWLAYDADEILFRARREAATCARLSPEGALALADAKGVRRPRGPLVSPATAHARLRTPRWWRRQYRQTFGRRAENAFRVAGLVHRRASPYATDDAVEAHRKRKRASAEWLADTAAVCQETGELFPLAELSAKSTSNPALRRAELMTRAKGFESIARQAGHECVFFTLTAPSRFHAFTHDGKANPNYLGATVRDAQSWLSTQWARARAKLKRLACLFYGFRVAEPHHDGCPHWHVLLFAPRHHAETLRQVVRGYWLADAGDEPGAQEHRCKVVTLDLERLGSDGRRSGAVGYISKYIAKAVDGFAVGTDDPAETELAGADAAERAEVWARTHGIRQFQQIGGPSVTLWREFRRLRDVLDDHALETIRANVDRGDWQGYVDALGGIERAQELTRTRLRVWSELPRVADPETGRELPKLSEYGELAAPRVRGIEWHGRGGRVRIRSRWSSWELTHMPREKSDSGSDSFRTRTRGNNCTRAPEAAADEQGAAPVGIPSMPPLEAPRGQDAAPYLPPELADATRRGLFGPRDRFT